MATIRRQSYIDKIEKYLGKETIIVLVGQRRVGKSCILKMIRDDKMADSDNNVIYIDKEKWQYDAIQTYRDLNEYIEKHNIPQDGEITKKQLEEYYPTIYDAFISQIEPKAEEKKEEVKAEEKKEDKKEEKKDDKKDEKKEDKTK